MEPDNRNMADLPTLSINPETTRNIFDFFSSITGGGGGDGLGSLFQTIWTVYSAIAFALSALFIYGIIYSYIKINEYGEYKVNKFKEEEKKWNQLKEPNQGNRRWKEVEEHVHSNNPNDWKLAIIESDVMLDKMLADAGFAGNTVADRIRSASGRSFTTIDDAWQAHRMRNKIAHGGTDFVLTQKMAQATLIQYRKVFEEFGII